MVVFWYEKPSFRSSKLPLAFDSSTATQTISNSPVSCASSRVGCLRAIDAELMPYPALDQPIQTRRESAAKNSRTGKPSMAERKLNCFCCVVRLTSSPNTPLFETFGRLRVHLATVGRRSSVTGITNRSARLPAKPLLAHSNFWKSQNIR